MTSEDLRRAYRDVRPGEDSKDRILAALLEENQAVQPEPAPETPRRKHRWFLPAACAAALVCLGLLSPFFRPAPTGQTPPERPPVSASAPRPERPLMQSAPPPAPAPAPPESLLWQEVTYTPVIGEAVAPEDLGEVLASGDEGTLFRLLDEDSRLVLDYGGQLYLYAPAR